MESKNYIEIWDFILKATNNISLKRRRDWEGKFRKVAALQLEGYKKNTEGFKIEKRKKEGLEQELGGSTKLHSHAPRDH